MHKIIAMWSHPRSMSTAMERVMRERGDLECAHEPFMYDYYVNRKVREMPHFDISPDHPTTYEGIRGMLMQKAEHGSVFFKDMSYYVMPHIAKDTEFTKRISHCFLIRNPIASIASYYKLDAEVTLEEIGLEAQWNHYQSLCEAGIKPAVIEAEAIRNNPETTIGALWEMIDLPYEKKGFEWQSEKPKDWEQVSGWHNDVAASTTIRPITTKEVEAQKQKFNALSNEAPHLKDYLSHHRPFYEMLKSKALNSLT